MNRIQTFCCALLASMLVSIPALAAPPTGELSYDFIGLGLALGEIDTAGDDVDFTNFTVNGSWAFHSNFALIGSIGAGEIDTAGDVDTTEISLGINPHFPITEQVHIVIPVALLWADYDGRGFSDDDTGYTVGLGVRALPSPAWEFSGGIQHVDIFDSSDQSFYANARWHLNDLFSLSAGGEFGDDVSAFVLGARFSF